MAAKKDGVQIEVLDRPGAAAMVAARRESLQASCEIHPAGKRLFAVTPVVTSDEATTNIGLISAVYKRALEHVARDRKAAIVYHVAEGAAYAQRMLSANGFTKRGGLYRANAARLLKTLGLAKASLPALLAHTIDHKIFDRNAALQAMLAAAARGAPRSGPGAPHLDAFDELDAAATAALVRLFERAGAPHLVAEQIVPAMHAEGRVFAAVADGELVAAMQLYATAPRHYTITPPVTIDGEASNIALLAALLKCALDDVVDRDAGATLAMHAAEDTPFAQGALRRAGFAAGRRGSKEGEQRFVALTARAADLRRHLDLDKVTVSDVLRLRISNRALERSGELLSMLSLAAVPLLRGCRRRPILLPAPRPYSGNEQTAKTPQAFTDVREGIVFVEELLQPAELRKLVNYVHRSEKRFKRSTILSKEGELLVARETRRSRVLMNVAGIRPMLQEKITALLPALKRELSIGSASPERIEMQITASNDGDLFRMHNDNGMLPQRRLSYVYFFFEEPRRFLGGQLCFYDEQNRRILTIRPKNNTIVFFRSERMHEVLRVRVPSRQFAHSRFTANGWVRR